MKKKVAVVLLCVAISPLLLNFNQSHAYLDPGTGSMLIQGLLAAIAAAGISLGVFWKRIKAFFGKSSHQDPKNGNE